MRGTGQAVAEGWRPGGLCSYFLCDVASFNDASRTDPIRVRVRRSMYEGLERSLEGAGLRLDECYHEDRGDGVMVIIPPEFRTGMLLTAVLDRLRTEVKHHNQASSEPAQMRLRVAVGVGETDADGRGIVSTALTHAFRLLDAQPLKEAVRTAGSGLAVIVSARVYDDVVRHGRGLIDPADYYKVDVSVKETSDVAWIRVPGTARPEDSGTTGAPVTGVSATDVMPAGERAPERTAPEVLVSLDAADSMRLMFQTVDELLGIPRLRSERGRDQVVGALSIAIAGSIPRSGEARSDLFAILGTCLDYPGGLQQFLQAIRGFVGESMAVRRVEETVALLIMIQQRGDAP